MHTKIQVITSWKQNLAAKVLKYNSCKTGTFTLWQWIPTFFLMGPPFYHRVQLMIVNTSDSVTYFMDISYYIIVTYIIRPAFNLYSTLVNPGCFKCAL